tara:strand:- start:310 stop:1152 length:843 start_codon:yes stop_codon:yes gene_type:complete
MNYLDALNFGSKLLKTNKITSYNLDSEILLSNTLNISREQLLINLDKFINKKNYYDYKKLLRRRKENEPIAYILKKKEFWKYRFIVNKNVLIPRPETELIVEHILKMIGFNSSKSILDVGTGSGCIIISILKERSNCNGTAIDISKNALKVAVSNAKMHHLLNKIKFINIDIDKFNHNKYDFILSNPPYISEIDLKRLEKSVLFEPKIALKAGQDGLSEIKKLILKSKSLLKLNGKLVFEIGFKQENKIKNFLKENGFYINKICKDIFRNARIIISTNQK